MASHKNHRIYSNREHLARIYDEQKNYIGRDVRFDEAEGCVIVFALPARYKKKSVREKRERERRERRERNMNREDD